MLQGLQRFLDLVTLWGWPDAPPRPLLLPSDVPRLPRPLPRAFDDVEAARMVQAAREAATPLERLIVELLAGCGLRAGEAYALQLSDVVTFGGAGHPASQPWLRVPLGKLGNDRYVPIGPELQAALDTFLTAERSSREWEELPTPPTWTHYLLAHQGRRVSTMYCNRVVQRFAARAGVVDAYAHRRRHTFATQAINRGWIWRRSPRCSGIRHWR
jgi:integrase